MAERGGPGQRRIERDVELEKGSNRWEGEWEQVLAGIERERRAWEQGRGYWEREQGSLEWERDVGGGRGGHCGIPQPFILPQVGQR